jgi:hypothetical protein
VQQFQQQQQPRHSQLLESGHEATANRLAVHTAGQRDIHNTKFSLPYCMPRWLLVQMPTLFLAIRRVRTANESVSPFTQGPPPVCPPWAGASAACWAALSRAPAAPGWAPAAAAAGAPAAPPVVHTAMC